MSNNTNLVKATKPTITSLFKQLDVAIPLEQLNVVLATPPPSAWVKQHPFIKGYNYLPIDKVEYLLRRLSRLVVFSLYFVRDGCDPLLFIYFN